jgi:TolB protein
VISVILDPYPFGAPQWSRDGDEIAVPIRDAAQNYVEIASLRTQESRRVALPQYHGNQCRDLSWSPDEHAFAYVETLGEEPEVARLWVVPFPEGEPIPVTNGRTNDLNPSWSPDGNTLFFISNRGGSMDLWQQPMGRDRKPEGQAEPVTTGLGIRSAALSPNGTKLAYSRGRRMSNVWRVPIFRDRPATWADAEQLTFDAAFIEFVDVSPDGKRVAVSSDRAGNQDL